MLNDQSHAPVCLVIVALILETCSNRICAKPIGGSE